MTPEFPGYNVMQGQNIVKTFFLHTGEYEYGRCPHYIYFFTHGRQQSYACGSEYNTWKKRKQIYRQKYLK